MYATFVFITSTYTSFLAYFRLHWSLSMVNVKLSPCVGKLHAVKLCLWVEAQFHAFLTSGFDSGWSPLLFGRCTPWERLWFLRWILLYITHLIINLCYVRRGADKSLARPRRKQATATALFCSWTVHVLISCLRKVRLAPDRSECNYCLSQGVSVSVFLLHVVSKYLNKFGFLVLQNVVSSFTIWQRVAHSSVVSSMTSKNRRLYVILKLKLYTDWIFWSLFT
jgi:hypothetical protein